MNNLTALDYLSAMRSQPYSSGYAQNPMDGQQTTFHSPQGAQGGGLINSFCGLGGKGKEAPGSAASKSSQVSAPNQIDVPYRENGLQLGGSSSWA